MLLARSGRLHLEHPYLRGPAGHRRDAGRDAGAHSAFAVAHRRRGDGFGRHDGGVDRLRDRGGALQRPSAAARRRGRHAADIDGRTEGARRKERQGARGRRRARHPPGPQELGGNEGARRGGTGRHHATLLRHRRRRPGRHRAGGAAAAARRANRHRGEERARRRFVAQPLQVALPARSGLVRPPALSAVSRRLAGVLAQGQDRRLAGGLCQDHGTELLALHRVQERGL